MHYKIQKVLRSKAKTALLRGNCMDLIKKIPDDSIDLFLTDIPYGEVNRARQGGNKSHGLRNIHKGKADETKSIRLTKLIKESIRVCKGSFYIFCGTEQVSLLRRFYVKAGLSTRLCIWSKPNPSPMNGKRLWLSSIECCIFAKKSGATFNEHCQPAVWIFPSGKATIHPTEKPLKLIKKLVLASSNEKDVVLDVCMGSGTTGVACIRTDRRFIGFELDKDFYKICKRRVKLAKRGFLKYNLSKQEELVLSMKPLFAV